MKRINNFLAGLSLISLTVLPCGCGNQAKQGNEDTTTEGKGSRRKMERVAEFHAPDYFNELYNNAEMRYPKGDNKEFTAWRGFRPSCWKNWVLPDRPAVEVYRSRKNRLGRPGIRTERTKI